MDVHDNRIAVRLRFLEERKQKKIIYCSWVEVACPVSMKLDSEHRSNRLETLIHADTAACRGERL